MVWILIFYFSGYLLLTGWLYYQWRNLPVFEPGPGHPLVQKISVIIPVRDESANILSLLHDLDRQQDADGNRLPASRMEVLVVDDHSEDETATLVQNFRPAHFSLRLLSLHLPKNFSGSHKKLAIAQAIRRARGEVIVTTDGDCRVPPLWLQTIGTYMRHKEAVMVSGPVTFDEERSLFEKMQTVEFASLIGTGAACMAAGYPNMCNGANLAFLKSAFEEVNGYRGSMHIPSGDDEFLLQKMQRRYPGRIFFLKSAAAVVRTAAQPDLLSFYYQRKRWAGKWKLHKGLMTALLALFIFSFHLLLIAGVLMTLSGQLDPLLMPLLLLFKAVSEYALLASVLKLAHKKPTLTNFMLLQLIYSAYAVFFGIVANFGGYQWKARKYSNKAKPTQV
jgi:cellulose synthase/poly-beta-1,6-N-acetylglucosamine synthase-like glycosyltransferase